MQLNIETKQPIAVTLHVYDYEGSVQIEENKYSLSMGVNNIVYNKPSMYEWYYYLIEYRDPLGNGYWYEINEWDY
ncbi:hypothetical protein [Neobacillus drentensis]|uniref:hypothetical protein n=1 Tax=Neobacillus drentensis TaxID=220684 RepID=UPI0028661625|nr:hypothetical protein [Neobacillus drentensis]MDR7240830.1 hypothetical protein [Neobacillus drentensis]